jgi:ankyrin repeat protein
LRRRSSHQATPLPDDDDDLALTDIAANVNLPDRNGRTALLLAAAHGHNEIANELINAGMWLRKIS